eukprot:1863018-Prymnesium_polylepis.1
MNVNTPRAHPARAPRACTPRTAPTPSARRAASQLLSAATPPPSSLDLDALRAAIDIAKDAGVPPQVVSSAEAKLATVIEGRVEAEAALNAAQAPPPSALDLANLSGAIEHCRVAGVASTVVEVAEAYWARATAERDAAAVHLGEPRPAE